MLTNVIQLGNVNVCGILESTNSNALKNVFLREFMKSYAPI